MALTEGRSPHRRYASIFSDDEDMHFSLANGHDSSVQMGSETAGQGDSGKQVAALVQQVSHTEPSQRQSGEWVSSERQVNLDTLSEGCCSMMTLDNGVSSPGANAGSDASMLSRCSSAEVADDSSSAQSALIGRKRSSSKLNPPKEEDRTLPLKKLFENLTNVDVVAAAAAQDHALLSNASSAAFVPNVSVPKAASVAGDAPQLDVPQKLSPDSLVNGDQRGLGSLRRVPSVAESLSGVGLSGKSTSLKGSPVRSSRSVVASPGQSAASFARNPWSSCDSLHHANGAPSASGLLHNLSQVRDGCAIAFFCASMALPLEWTSALGHGEGAAYDDCCLLTCAALLGAGEAQGGPGTEGDAAQGGSSCHEQDGVQEPGGTGSVWSGHWLQQ